MADIWHLVFEVLAYTIGFQFYVWIRRQSPDHISEPARFWLIIAAALGAVIGSKLTGYFSLPQGLRPESALAIITFSGKSIVGGLVGGAIGVEICKRFLGIVRATGDVFVFPLILAMMIGRIGCFLAGWPDGTYGLATGGPWGWDFGDGISRHPTQIYDIVFLGGLGALLWAFKEHWREGMVFKVFLFTYLLYRLAIEEIKPAWAVYSGFTAVQWACLFGIGMYLVILIRQWSQPAGDIQKV